MSVSPLWCSHKSCRAAAEADLSSRSKPTTRGSSRRSHVCQAATESKPVARGPCRNSRLVQHLRREVALERGGPAEPLGVASPRAVVSAARCRAGGGRCFELAQGARAGSLLANGMGTREVQSHKLLGAAAAGRRCRKAPKGHSKSSCGLARDLTARQPLIVGDAIRRLEATRREQASGWPASPRRASRPSRQRIARRQRLFHDDNRRVGARAAASDRAPSIADPSSISQPVDVEGF
jgi:hypothetical protein